MSKFLPFLLAGAIAQQVLEETKSCPAGFEMLGKQCIQTVTIAPQFVCAPGTTPLDGECVAYSAKLVDCAAGYTFADGLCVRTQAVAPALSCPAGFVLVDDATCMKQLELPHSYACPAGAVAKGDTCYAVTTVEPEHLCASGILQGNLCVSEETYDCTPAVGEAGIVDACAPGTAPGPVGATQTALLRAKAKFAATGKEPGVGDADACELCSWNNGCGPSTGTGIAKNRPQFVEETLVSAKCKRITVEPAAKHCAVGRLDGKVCLVETPVDAIIVPGGFATETIAASAVCPPGYSAAEGLLLTPAHCATGALECVRAETTPALYNCAFGSVDLGDRCGIFSAPRAICEDGFHLANGVCTKTLTAEPILEYTVRYTCTGKDCAAI